MFIPIGKPVEPNFLGTTSKAPGYEMLCIMATVKKNTSTLGFVMHQLSMFVWDLHPVLWHSLLDIFAYKQLTQHVECMSLQYIGLTHIALSTKAINHLGISSYGPRSWHDWIWNEKNLSAALLGISGKRRTALDSQDLCSPEVALF